MKKRQIAAVLAGIMAMSLAVPAMAADETEGEEVKLLIAAAASLEYSMEEKLIPLFEEQNPGVKVEGSYDSSGKLQTQIEEGMEADLFFSAATKQMDALTEEGYMKEDSEADLLENKIVAIVPKDSTLEQFRGSGQCRDRRSRRSGQRSRRPVCERGPHQPESLG